MSIFLAQSNTTRRDFIKKIGASTATLYFSSLGLGWFKNAWAQQSFSTIAACELAAGPATTDICYIAEVDAHYQWYPGDTSTINHWVVLGATGGTAGRWKLVGDKISLAPRGSGLDDQPRLQAILNATAYLAKVQLLPGTFTIANPIIVPSGSYLVGSVAVKIKSTITPTGPSGNVGGFAQTVFYAYANPNGSVYTINSASVGSNTISAQGSFSVGSVVLLKNSNVANCAQMLTVTNVSGGSAPYTLTFDDPIAYGYFNQAGANIQAYTVPQDIRIYGNGMTISGSGDRAIEISAGYNCHVEQVIVDCRLTNTYFMSIVMSYDIGSRDCRFVRCQVDGGSWIDGKGSQGGIALESAYRCAIMSCDVQYVNATVSAAGVFIPTSRLATINDCVVNKCTFGLVGTGASGAPNQPDSEGLRDSAIENCSFNGGTMGMYLADGCLNINLVDVQCSRNSSHGILLGYNGYGSPQDIYASNLILNDNQGVAIRAEGATQFFIRNLRSNNCTLGVLDVAGATTLIQVDGFVLGYSANGVAGQWSALTNILGEVQLYNGKVKLNSDTAKVTSLCDWQTGTGTLRLANVQSVYGKYGVYAAHALAVKVYRGPNVDLSSVATAAWTFDSSAYKNFGQIILGTTASPVTKVLCNATDIIVLTRRSSSGTVGKTPQAVAGASQFTFSYDAGDTSVYDWDVLT